MALVLFGDIAGMRAFHTERGNSAPTDALDVDVQAALVRASDYMSAHYLNRLAAAYDETLPELTTAAYIAADYELTTPGFFSKTYTEAERKVLTKVDMIQWEVVGDATKVDSQIPRSTIIDALLRPYLSYNTVTAFAVV